MKAALALTVLAVTVYAAAAAAWQGGTVRIGVYNHDGPFALLDEAGNATGACRRGLVAVVLPPRRPRTPWPR